MIKGNFMHRFISHIRGSIGLFLISVLIVPYLYFLHVKKRKKQEIEKREYQRIIKRQKQYHNRMMRRNIGIRKFQHDIRNQLFCLKRFLESGDIDGGLEYLQDMMHDCSKTGTKVETGNYIIDIVVEDIIKEEDHIAVEWNGCFPEKTKIKDTDLSILFANILKNAKEEIMDIPDKKITITVKLSSGAIFVSCKNAVDSSRIRPEKGEGRGIGLIKVKEIVERYHGDMKIERGEEFTIQLLFYDIVNCADAQASHQPGGW